MTSVTCLCGVQIPLEEEDMGTQVFCPSCGAAITAPNWKIEVTGDNADEVRAVAQSLAESMAKVDEQIAPNALDNAAPPAHPAPVMDAPNGSAPAPKVFISHSAKDKEFVEREVVSLLQRHGIETWYCKTDVCGSDQWERAILKGLQSCSWFLLVLSPRSATSEWVKDELHWAVDERPDKIIPILMEDCDFQQFHIRLARIQFIDFRQVSPHAQKQLLALLEQ